MKKGLSVFVVLAVVIRTSAIQLCSDLSFGSPSFANDGVCQHIPQNPSFQILANTFNSFCYATHELFEDAQIVESFSLQLKLRLSCTAPLCADGVALSFGTTNGGLPQSYTGAAAGCCGREGGVGSGIRISFDPYQLFTGYGFKVTRGANLLLANDPQFIPANYFMNSLQQLSLTVNSSGEASISYDNNMGGKVVDLDFMVPGWPLPLQRLAYGGRTGGASMLAEISQVTFCHTVDTAAPTQTPTTLTPTRTPTLAPTRTPTLSPTVSPTRTPTLSPTVSPTRTPTMSPTVSPTRTPTMSLSVSPTRTPTMSPTRAPTDSPTMSPNAPLNCANIEMQLLGISCSHQDLNYFIVNSSTAVLIPFSNFTGITMYFTSGSSIVTPQQGGCVQMEGFIVVVDSDALPAPVVTFPCSSGIPEIQVQHSGCEMATATPEVTSTSLAVAVALDGSPCGSLEPRWIALIAVAAVIVAVLVPIVALLCYREHRRSQRMKGKLGKLDEEFALTKLDPPPRPERTHPDL